MGLTERERFKRSVDRKVHNGFRDSPKRPGFGLLEPFDASARPQRGSVWGSQPGARHTRVPSESVSKRAAAGRQIADPVRARRLREDAKRPMGTNLAEGIALSHKLLRFVGVARRG